MEFQRLVDPLPQIRIANRFLNTKSLPLIIGLTPGSEPIFESPRHVTAGGHQVDVTGLLERLESAYNRQQGQTVRVYRRLRVSDFQMLGSVESFQHEMPATKHLAGSG